jgi:MATE family multidrug resistance protein
MRDAAIQSLAIFLLAWSLLVDAYAVAGLWWAMIIYVVARALCLLRYYPAIFPARQKYS